jgi:soluble lytic murein transglycosylase-like protein
MGPAPVANGTVEQTVLFWAPQIRAASQHMGVPAAFIAAIMAVESGGDPRLVSSVGAIGLMQVLPGHFASGQNPWNATTNIRVGTQFLATLAHEFHDVWALVAAGYNAGPGAVIAYHGIPPYPQTMAYVPDVLGYYRAFQQAKSLGV